MPEQENDVKILDQLLEEIKKLRQIQLETTMQLKVSNRVKDDKIRFLYHDRWIEMHVPEASSDPIQRALVDKSTFKDVELLELLDEYIQPEAVAVDAGANIGNSTLWLAGHSNITKIWAFEPQLNAWKILCDNIELNGFDKKVAAARRGLAYMPTRLKLNTHRGNRHAAFTIDKEGEYEAIPLDALGLERLDIFKINVGGMQLEVLEGASETISKCHPVIMIDMLGQQMNQAADTGDFDHENTKPKQWLWNHGYGLEALTPTCYLAKPR